MIARKRKHVTGRNRVQILENHKRTRMMMARFNRFRTLTDSRSGIFARSTDSPTMQHFQDAQRIPSLRRKQSHFWQTRSSRMAFQWYFTSSCPTGRWLIPLQRQQARNQNYWTLYIVSAQQSLSKNHEQLWIPAERGYAASNSMKWLESDPLSLSAK